MASRILISELIPERTSELTLEPQAQCGFETAHWIGGNREAELRAVYGRVPASENTVIEQVGCVHAQVQIKV
jgi:hypothetical protein